MTLDELIAHLTELRQGVDGDTLVFNTDGVPFEVAVFDEDDGPAVTLLFETVSF